MSLGFKRLNSITSQKMLILMPSFCSGYTYQVWSLDQYTNYTDILIMIYLSTAIGLSPGGSSTIHIYTQTVYRTTQNKQYIEWHNNFGRVRAVLCLGELYPGICLTSEEKALEYLILFFNLCTQVNWSMAPSPHISFSSSVLARK